MILNDNNNGAAEIRRLTGSYYANNDFAQIELDVAQAEDSLRQVISDAVFDSAERLYHDNSHSGNELSFVTKVQRPVAMLAALNYMRKNDVSHEDSGRKVKTTSDDSEKIPWEWQLDRDDAVHLEAYYQAVESLIRFLNTTKNPEWLASDQYKAAQGLLITSGQQFDNYFPIDKSERMFILLIGFIREVQLAYIAPSYGDRFKELLADRTLPESDAHFAACKACALMAMSVALRRLPLSLIPAGVIRGYSAQNGASDSKPATVREIRTVADWMEGDAMQWLGRMKEYRDGPSDKKISITPDNDQRNKFFRT